MVILTCIKDDDRRRKYIKKNVFFADIVDTPKRVFSSIVNKNFNGYNKQRQSIKWQKTINI